MNCALQQLGRPRVCTNLDDLVGCVSSLSESQFALYNSYYIHFRNACAYFKLLAVERSNSHALGRITKLHKYMRSLIKDSANITTKLYDRYSSVEQRLSDIQLLTTLSHEKLNSSFSALTSQTEEVNLILNSTKQHTQAIENLWRNVLNPRNLLESLRISGHTRELVTFYAAMSGWILLLSVSGRYHVGPFFIVLLAALGLELWMAEARLHHRLLLQKVTKAFVLGGFFYMTLFHFERATLGNIYMRLGHLERSERIMERPHVY